MGVSVSGSDLTFTTVRRMAVAVVAIFCTLFYLYGPAASPTLHDAAISECNDHAEGNWRSYRLTWHVSVYPHWTCGDASRPAKREISLGWWTDPRRA
jgi:hypothetical protein